MLHKNEKIPQNHAQIFPHPLPLKSETQRRKEEEKKKRSIEKGGGGGRILVKHQASGRKFWNPIKPKEAGCGGEQG